MRNLQGFANSNGQAPKLRSESEIQERRLRVEESRARSRCGVEAKFSAFSKGESCLWENAVRFMIARVMEIFVIEKNER